MITVENRKPQTTRLADIAFYDLTLNQIFDEMTEYLKSCNIKNNIQSEMNEKVEELLHKKYPVESARGGAHYGLFFSFINCTVKFKPKLKKTNKTKKVSNTRRAVVYEFEGLKKVPYHTSSNMNSKLKELMSGSEFTYISNILENLYNSEKTLILTLERQFNIKIDSFDDEKMMHDYIGKTSDWHLSMKYDSLLQLIYPRCYGYYTLTYVYKEQSNYSGAEPYGYFDKSVKQAKKIFTLDGDLK